MEEETAVDRLLNLGPVQAETETAVDKLLRLETTEQKPKTAVDKLLQLEEPEVSPVVTFNEEGAPTINRSGYSQNDLVKDEFYGPVLDYMTSRFGNQHKDKDREEVVNKFLNNMRGFNAGNSVASVAEISRLNSLESEEDKKSFAAAYALYDGMEGLFGDTSLGEKGEVVKDYLGSIVLDPINLVSLGVGKIASMGGVRLATQAAQREATKLVAKEVAKGVTKKEAVKKAAKIYGATVAATQVELVKKATAKAATTETTKQTLKQTLTSAGAREIYAAGTIDGLAAASTDYMWQNAMLRTQVQEDYSKIQTGVAALSSIVSMGAIAGASRLLKRDSIGPEFFKTKTDGASLSNMSDSIKKYLESVENKPIGPTGKDVQRVPYTRQKIELEAADSDFFIKFILGDDEAGIDGLAKTLETQGYAWSKRDKDDTITQFLADVVQQSDPTEFKAVLTDYTKAYGVEITDIESMSNAGFAKIFKEKMSYQGSVFNALSQAAKRLGIKESDVTLGDYIQLELTGTVPRKSTKSEKIKKGLVQRFGLTVDNTVAVQNRLIRLLVSNPATTALNVSGFALATTMNTTADLGMAVLNASSSVMKAAVGKDTVKGAKEELINALGNTRFKLANLLDPEGSVEMMKRYSAVRPEAVQEFNRVIPGGVENLEKLSKSFDEDLTVLGARSDKVIDTIQDFAMVTAQDSLTKSVEFLTQMDKATRNLYGKSYKEFMESPDHALKMQTKEFKVMELKAVDETLSTIFSKSYKGNTGVGEVAGFIEDARNLPGVGMLVPFGRFFNNTLAFMADNSGISAIGRIFGVQRADSSYTTQELIVRGAVGIGTVWSMVDQEVEYIEKGYSWSQADDARGAVIDEKFNFPYSAYKAAARIVAHRLKREEDVPEGVATDIADVFFGQFTRNLDASGEGLISMIQTFTSADGPEIMQVVQDTVSKIASQYVSAGTRFIEPANLAVGLARGEDFKVVDTKQGNTTLRQAFRYMDQFTDILSGGSQEERFSPTQGTIQSQASKSFSTSREVDLTDLERVYNMVGVQPYTAGLRADDPALKNRFAELFFKMNEATATALLNSSSWKSAGQKQKKMLFNDFVNKNKQSVVEIMKLGFVSGDKEKSLILDIEQKTGKKELRDILEELEIDQDLGDLGIEQLYVIDKYVDIREDLMKFNLR